jgi:hypothetical protein
MDEGFHYSHFYMLPVPNDENLRQNLKSGERSFLSFISISSFVFSLVLHQSL